MIGIDFETVGLAPKRGNLRLMQMANGKGPRVLDAWGPAGSELDAILAALAGQELVAHNASFEEGWMREYGVELPEGMHDTMIAWMVLQQAEAPRSPDRMPRSLGHVAKEVLGEELDKEMQTSDWSLPTLSARQWAYAEKDAEILVPLHRELMRRIEADGLEFVYDIERRARPFFDWMRRTGMYVDVPKLRAAMDELRVEQEEKGEWLKKNADINWGSSKQLREHFELEARHGWPKTKGRQTEDRSGGERIRGHEKMREFQEAYPTPPYARLRRVLVRDGLWVAEGVIDYGGGRVSNIAVIFELKDGKIWRDTRYYAEAFEAPERRAQWVERMEA